MARYIALRALSAFPLTDRQGNAQAGRQLYVYLHGTNTRVPVYPNPDGSGTALTPPLTTDTDGAPAGYVAAEQDLDVLDVAANKTIQTWAMTPLDYVGTDGKIGGPGSLGLSGSGGGGGGGTTVVATPFEGTNYFLPPTADTSGAAVSNNTANAVMIDSSGRFIIAGEVAIGGVQAVAVCRVLATGELDTSFGTSGWFTHSGGGDIAQGLALQADGKILVSGGFGGNNAYVLRLTTSGVLDTTFNPSGGTPGINQFVPSGSSAGNTLSFGVAQDQNGKVVATGTSIRTSDGKQVTFLTRFTSAGVVDTSFNATGTVMILGPTGGSSGWNVIVDSSNRYIIGGEGVVNFSTTVAGGSTLAIGSTTLPVGSVGALPAGIQAGDSLVLGTGGGAETVSVTGAPSGTNVPISATVKTHAVGAAVATSNNVLLAFRVTQAGAADPTFNTTGWNQAFGGFSMSGLTVALQSTGKYVIGGYQFQSNLAQWVAAARFNVDGSLDTSFGTSGIAAYAPQQLVNAMVTQADDRILFGAGPVARLLPNGQADQSFGVGGFVAPFRSGINAWWATNGVAVTTDMSTIVLSGRGIPASGVMSFAIALLDNHGNAQGEGIPIALYAGDPATPAAPANGAVALPVGATRGRTVWAALTGDGSTTQFTVQHDLGTQLAYAEGFPSVGGKPGGGKIVLSQAPNPVDLLASLLVNFPTAPATGTTTWIRVTA